MYMHNFYLLLQVTAAFVDITAKVTLSLMEVMSESAAVTHFLCVLLYCQLVHINFYRLVVFLHQLKR